jgi:hypothetical protein
MVMGKMSEKSGVNDSRTLYTPPCVVRISNLKLGVGDCTPVGSGDDASCHTGNSATDHGCSTGNSAVGGCSSGNLGTV